MDIRLTFLACPAVYLKATQNEEAVENIKEAIELYIEPVDDDTDYGSNSEVMDLAV